jgi:uncharacterized protein (TIGR03067 family)
MFTFFKIAGAGLICLTVTMFAYSGDAKEEAIKKDRKMIEGTWRIVSLELNGNKGGEDDLKKLKVVNGPDGTWSFHSDGKEVMKGISTFDPTMKPKTIDFSPIEGESAGKEFLGIYELGEKTRKMCFAPPGMNRPTEFSSITGSGHIFITLQREKSK